MTRSAAPARRPAPHVLGQTANLVGRQAAVVAVSLVANVISARTLGADGRGALAFALQAAFMVSFAVLLGTEKAVAVVMPGAPTTRGIPAILSVSWRRAGFTAAVGIVALGLTAAGTDLVALRYVAPVAAMALASGLSRALESSAINAHRAAIALANSSGASVVSLILIAGLALAEVRDPAVWVAAYACGAFLVGISLIHRFGSWSNLDLGSGRSSTLDRLANTGLRLFPASLASYAAYRSDRLILPVLADTEALGLYVVVVAFTDVVAAPVEALANALLPRWRAAVLNGTFAPRRIVVAAIAYLAVAAVGSVLAGRHLIVPIFGEDYAAGRDLLPLLAFGSALYPLGRLAAAYRLAQGYVNLASGADLVGMITAVAAYFLLIPGLEAQGAALGAAIGYASGIVVLVAGKRWASTEPDGDHPGPPAG